MNQHKREKNPSFFVDVNPCFVGNVHNLLLCEFSNIFCLHFRTTTCPNCYTQCHKPHRRRATICPTPHRSTEAGTKMPTTRVHQPSQQHLTAWTCAPVMRPRTVYANCVNPHGRPGDSDRVSSVCVSTYFYIFFFFSKSVLQIRVFKKPLF